MNANTLKVLTTCALLMGIAPAAAQPQLAPGFANPPHAAKPRVYWWWLMSLVSKEGITQDLEEMAAKGIGGVLLNGKNLGVVWAEPFQVELTGAVKTEGNKLEIDVVNLWPNRLIGDAARPKEQRFTRSNVALRQDAKLLDSGLDGPVCLQPSREEAK